MKFRIWDYDSKTFYYSDSVPITIYGRQIIVDGHMIVNYAINRFTGWQDSLNQDVYENDIVVTSARDSVPTIVTYDPEYEFELTDYNCFRQCKVIGNIYQNFDKIKS